MDKDFEDISPKKVSTNGQQTHGKMLNVMSHSANANPKHEKQFSPTRAAARKTDNDSHW